MAAVDRQARNSSRFKLGGLRRAPLIRALALSGRTQTDLAEEYGVTQQSISEFAQRNRAEIDALKADAANEFAGVLIAQKINRVVALEEILEAALEPKPKTDNKGFQVVDPDTGDPVYEVDGRTALAALKQAAEEMGQLVQRTQVAGDLNTTTTYRIEGVDPADLK